MIETYKEFTFEAAHALPPFAGLHGHTFLVRVGLRGEPDPTFGWAANLYEVDREIEAVRVSLDHKYLNEIEGLANPSLENIARWIWANLAPKITGLDQVVVSRGTPGQAEGCIYRGGAPRSTEASAA
ncbi:6-carboxytetrahydropterin synthase [Chelatococcus sp. SYSU_G07232]|uniref:6-carboxy-5,6,7,8-tetrahydropterin synthase n=1 Tax=Chelatococcus albus TaxID=3047466 RepID=A0ABT7AEJ6_9HYPH|nr:6-carboxytetrahydropterin synthase [Chelatococcus sp. SYSU_G07232]MDJ1157782.1 6-carboxytetrahydropterin synthase [Chelatococcus sp. SYSU_G07232]